ncbi:fibronectin type III domain-containing protein [Microbacterium paludicola]|uniref:fibronectin type III domain-containing protein n=1 Tax=Microbacterium paludicola TaxID=300019 RepID=UPI00119E7FBC|nr:fibronectin type III domain-containing protein [Microbacterium paludicola]
MASATGSLSGSGPQQAYIELTYQSYNLAGNYSTWYYRAIYKGNGWGSWSASSQSWSLSGFAVASGNFTIPSPGTGDIVLASGTFRKYHDSSGYLNAGTLTLWITTNHSTIGSGSASVGSGTPPRIPKAPAAPSPLGLDQILPTSMRYRFSANSNNGSSVVEYQAQLATNSAFSQNVQSWSHPTSGTKVFEGLTPATKYYARSRARNAVGWSSWSSVISADTLAGGRVKSGGWGDATPWEKVGGTWRRVRPFEKQSGTWRAVR